MVSCDGTMTGRLYWWVGCEGIVGGYARRVKWEGCM